MIRRLFVSVLVAALAGAAVTVAIAWAFAARDRGFVATDSVPPRLDTWSSTRPEGCPAEPQLFFSDAAASRGITRQVLRTYEWPDQERPRSHALIVCDVGWPWPALRGGEWFVQEGAIWEDGAVRRQPYRSLRLSRDPIESVVGAKPGTYLPLQPVWVGFALDTLLFGGGLWLLVALPWAWRRRRRRRRRECLACGYPVGDSTACAECGQVNEHAASGEFSGT